MSSKSFPTFLFSSVSSWTSWSSTPHLQFRQIFLLKEKTPFFIIYFFGGGGEYLWKQFKPYTTIQKMCGHLDFLKEINSFIQQGLKLIKSNTKDIYIVRKDFDFK